MKDAFTAGIEPFKDKGGAAAQRATKLPGKAGWPIVVTEKKAKPISE